MFCFSFSHIQSTVYCYSSLWINNDTFNIVCGEARFDLYEAKLSTYWNTTFTKICFGMRFVNRSRSCHQQACQLPVLRDCRREITWIDHCRTWRTLIGSEASLQSHWSQEGSNVVGSSAAHFKARIGVLGTNENDGGTFDSRLGFGTGSRGS